LKTGDNGEDATARYDDPKALGRIFVGPYVELEPELVFVLEDGLGVCGYVLGAMDSRRFYKAYVEEWLPPIRARHEAPAGDDSSGWTPTQRVYHEYHHPELFCPEPYNLYPSHLHIDLLPRAQGQGYGRAMMDRLLGELRIRGSPGVHLGVGIGNERALRFYRRFGFVELAHERDVLYLGLRLE
jgi:ribosomal protein S18 acetylase RimI-like enzyme